MKSKLPTVNREFIRNLPRLECSECRWAGWSTCKSFHAEISYLTEWVEPACHLITKTQNGFSSTSFNRPWLPCYGPSALLHAPLPWHSHCSRWQHLDEGAVPVVPPLTPRHLSDAPEPAPWSNDLSMGGHCCKLPTLEGQDRRGSERLDTVHFGSFQK